MDGVIGIAAVAAMLLAAGGAIAAFGRGGVAPGWLLAAAALVILNDAALTRLYGLVPPLPGLAWNWAGKAAALALTLAAAALLGRRRCGLTIAQAPGSVRAALPAMLAYAAFVAALALLAPDEATTRETVAFQLTMPGLEEEAFYRGVLLAVLDRAFPARRRWLGVEWGWGTLLSAALFGLAHAFGYGDGRFGFDAPTMALTALPALVLTWVRRRTGSVAWPVVLHNAGNALALVL